MQQYYCCGCEVVKFQVEATTSTACQIVMCQTFEVKYGSRPPHQINKNFEVLQHLGNNFMNLCNPSEHI